MCSNVRLPNACMHRNISCVHVRRSARPSWCPSEFQNSAAHSCFFVEPGVKINGVYYRDVVLTQKLLSVVKHLWGNEFVFQQDSAPAHRARDTLSAYVERRRSLFHRNSGHRTVQFLTRRLQNLGYNVAALLPAKDSKCWRTVDSVCWTFGAALNKTSSTHPLTSGVCDSKHACVREADILNTCCKFICIDIRTSR